MKKNTSWHGTSVPVTFSVIVKVYSPEGRFLNLYVYPGLSKDGWVGNPNRFELPVKSTFEPSGPIKEILNPLYAVVLRTLDEILKNISLEYPPVVANQSIVPEGSG